MGRPGIEQGKIRDVIDELDAEGKAISVTSIRERLGSGSYSTIGAVLAAWRKERAKAVLPNVPAIPEGVSRLVGNLRAEAWKAADSNYEPERQTFQRERAEHERLRGEMAEEITRLEVELSRVVAECESVRVALAKAEEEACAGAGRAGERRGHGRHTSGRACGASGREPESAGDGHGLGGAGKSSGGPARRACQRCRGAPIVTHGAAMASPLKFRRGFGYRDCFLRLLP